LAKPIQKHKFTQKMPKQNTILLKKISKQRFYDKTLFISLSNLLSHYCLRLIKLQLHFQLPGWCRVINLTVNQRNSMRKTSTFKLWRFYRYM